MDADSSDLIWTQKRVLIIGRASPEPSKKHIETVCTGGITELGELLRLYPIPLRYLQQEQRYKQWSWAEFEIRKSPSDKRKESYIVRQDTIRVLGQVDSEAERFHLLSKGIVSDKETLDVMRQKDRTSIGLVEIDVQDFVGKPRRREWSKEKPYIKQSHLYVEKKPLEQPPIEVQIKFRCKSNPSCKAHQCSLIGWEYTEGLRKFVIKYDSLDGAFMRLREALAKRYMDPAKRTFALMGTHFKYASWMVAQLYAFPRDIAPLLF
jgi:hypothetical protein